MPIRQTANVPKSMRSTMAHPRLRFSVIGFSRTYFKRHIAAVKEGDMYSWDNCELCVGGRGGEGEVSMNRCRE